MKIAICDDSLDDAIYLKNLLGQHDTDVFLSGEELLENILHNNIRYDLYMLDIFISDDLNGIDLAKRLRSEYNDAVICFVSVSDDFYRDAYDLYDVNYLLKPVNGKKVERLIERLTIKNRKTKEQSLPFRWNGQMGTIPYEKILFISSDAHTINIHCDDGTIQECKGKLNEIETQVQGDVFFRCHQSFLVNIYQVDRLEDNILAVKGHQIPVSRRYYNDIKIRYTEVMFEEIN